VIKADMVNQMASKAGISKVAAEKTLKAFTDGVTAALKKGDKVSLVGFGTFSVSKRAARKGRNPQTGKEINIRASKSPKFKAGKALKKAVNR
jgi:DNA-binding protein HU-beta